MRMREFVTDDLEVPRAQVLTMLGCSHERSPSDRLCRQIDDAVRGIGECLACRSAYQSYPIRVEAGRVQVGNDVVLTSTRLAQALRPCHRLFVYVVTLGPEVDEFVGYWMQRRPALGVVVDAAASALADSMVGQIEQELSESLPPSQALGLPFSPGYCDWSIREQTKLFRLLPDGAAGVALSAESMMSPRKSVSGVLGVGPVVAVTKAKSPCFSCARIDCDHRRRPYEGR
jgi:hypothetical protein